MKSYTPYLSSIQSQQAEMEALLIEWSHINSGSTHLQGLAQMLIACQQAFSDLEARETILDLPPRKVIDSHGRVQKESLGKALHLIKRPSAPLQVFLGGHLDTVFPKESPFQRTTRHNDGTLQGPGVADLKGGLVVMLHALKALESSPWAENIGWEVLLNPDEEIGSPGSSDFLFRCGKNNQLGLIFEPSLPTGSFVSERKGSANYTLIMRGRSAHAGREYYEGRNAIFALADVLQTLEHFNDPKQSLTVNAGHIEGGGPVNIVPDLAIARVNMRMGQDVNIDELRHTLRDIETSFNSRDGFSFEIVGDITRAPKPFDAKSKKLFEAVKACADDLGQPCSWQPSGGVCDGNIIASAGCPVIDTLGVRGGKIHTHDEFMILESLQERACLTALLLMRLASGEIHWKEECYDAIDR